MQGQVTHCSLVYNILRKRRVRLEAADGGSKKRSKQTNSMTLYKENWRRETKLGSELGLENSPESLY